jgi:uncharacterized Zn-binding protein involved in type VI secretion
MPPAARKMDNVLHDVAAHCHVGHPTPGGPVPTPVPAGPLPIQLATVPTVKIKGMEAATMTSQTAPCKLVCQLPAGGPGAIAKGSATVKIGKKPAARMGDMVDFKVCGVAPTGVPAPTGKIIPPCCPTVIIGG